jgi:hypothetical protein
MLPTQARGSTLGCTLAALLLGWCAVEGASSDRYGLRASFDGAQIELRLTLPSVCLQLSATLLAEITSLRSVSICTHCRSPERSWS